MSTNLRLELMLPNWNRLKDLALHHYDHFLINWWATFSVSASAAMIAMIVALSIAILSIRFKLIRCLVNPIAAASQSFPLQAVAPLLIVVLGVGFTTKLLIAYVIAFFPIYSICVTALENLPQPLKAQISICNGSFLNGMRYIHIPYALPEIISSAKVGFTLAVLGAVVAEFIQPDEGLGQLLLIAQSSFDIEVIYICILLLIVQGIAVYSLLEVIEKKITSKRRVL